MGLDTSHDAWHGPYGAFARWRNHIAEIAGFEMGNGELGRTYLLPWDAITDDNVQGEWPTPPPIHIDSLIYLLCHSDCDGVIHPEQGGQIARRLREILPETSDDGPIWSMRAATEQFAAGLERAAAAGEDVEFR